MGQGFSNDICISDSPTSAKSLMMFAVEGSEVNPVPSACFFRNISQFFDKTVILIEPTPSPPQRTAEYMYPKMSCKETVRTINEIFKITPTVSKNLKVWIFSPSTQVPSEKSRIMTIIKKTNFEQFSSRVDFSPSSLFTESSELLPKSVSEAIKRNPRTPRKTDVLLLTPSKGYRPLIYLDDNFIPAYSPTGSPKTTKIYRDTCDLIVEGLFISGEKISSDLPQLLANGITHIVNVNASSSPLYFPEEFTYFSVHLEDSVFENLNDEFWAGVAFTDDAIKKGGKVLIHCRMGISRSAAMCLAYLVERRHMKIPDAMELIRKARPCVNINKGFLQQIEARVAGNA